MFTYNDPPILQKAYDIYRDVYLTIEKMPKKDKYTLGERIQKTILDVIEFLVAASFARDDKFLYLNKAAVKLDTLKLFIRLAEEIHALPTKRALDFQEKLQEIGKMLGGWIRASK